MVNATNNRSQYKNASSFLRKKVCSYKSSNKKLLSKQYVSFISGNNA